MKPRKGLRYAARAAAGVLAVGMGFLASVVAVGTPAMARDGRNPNSIVILEDDGTVVTVPNPNLGGKRKDDSGFPAVSTDTDTEALRLPCESTNSCWLFPSASQTLYPPGGTAAEGRVRGQTNYIPYHFIIPLVSDTVTSIDYYSTSSRSSWLGSKPYNANSIVHSDTFDIDWAFINGSFSWGGAGGATNFGGGRVGWTVTGYNTWYVQRSFNHIYLSCAPCHIWRTRYQVSGAFQFGSSYFPQINAYSTAWW